VFEPAIEPDDLKEQAAKLMEQAAKRIAFNNKQKEELERHLKEEETERLKKNERLAKKRELSPPPPPPKIQELPLTFVWPKDEYGFKKLMSEWTPDEQRKYKEYQQQQREQAKKRAEENRRKEDEEQKKIDEYKEIIHPILERFVSRYGSSGALTIRAFPEHKVGPFWHSGGYEWTLLGGNGTVRFELEGEPSQIRIDGSKSEARRAQWEELGGVLKQHTGLDVFVSLGVSRNNNPPPITGPFRGAWSGLR
jgi:hypothetical protein